MVTTFMIALLASSCGKASKDHVEAAKENFKEAGHELKSAVADANEEAKENAKEDWQKFKNESDVQIAEMENRISALKQKISTASKREKVKLNRTLDKNEQKLKEEKEKLRQRNIEFQADMNKFGDSVVVKNESFKREFKHDMDELGTSFKDLFHDNVK